MAERSERRAEFDWLRIVAIGLMMLFHSCLGFSSWPWHVNDPHRSVALGEVLSFLWRWRVALVFVVSGAALMLALSNHRSRHRPRDILRERLRRLGIPLVFGILVIVPPQVYYERLQRGQFHGSYLDFQPHLFDGIYPSGNLSWHHLWFIPYLLVLTAIGIPLLGWMRSASGRRLLDAAMDGVSRWHLYWLLALPMMLCHLVLRLQHGDDHTFVGDPHGWLEFAILMVLGATLAQWPQVLAAVQRGRYVAVLVGTVCFFLLKHDWPTIGDDPTGLPLDSAIAWSAVAGLDVLAWVLAVTGFVTRLLTRDTPLLRYATEAALPVYVLHQTLIVYAVYHLAHVNWPLGVKIVMTLSFCVLGSLAIYEGAIRRNRWLRLLFGVKDRAADIGLESLIASVGERLTSRRRARSS